MNIYLCKPDESLEQALEAIMEKDPDGMKFTGDQVKDRCYVGDEAFVNAPVIVNKNNQYYALKQV